MPEQALVQLLHGQMKLDLESSNCDARGQYWYWERPVIVMWDAIIDIVRDQYLY